MKFKEIMVGATLGFFTTSILSLLITVVKVNKSKTDDNFETAFKITTDYKAEDLGRVRLITYTDKENGNVVYISYDNKYSNASRIEGFGMTSQPLRK